MQSRKRLVSDGATSKYFKRKVSKSLKNGLLTRHFYERDCVDVAKSLLGQIIVRSLKNKEVRCKIIEVESYLGKGDKASHSYNGKETPRNKAMFMDPGTLYVYMTYGMYFCMNISVGGAGDAVLIRAVQPIDEKEIMKANRILLQKSKQELKDKDVCNGPSKLCQALQVDRSLDQIDLTKSEDMWLEEGESISNDQIVCCKRVGLGSKAEEWIHKPLRFYLLGNVFVSVRNKSAEKEMRKKRIS